MKLLSPKYNYDVMLPNSYTHISVSDLYISRIGLPILPLGNMWTDPVAHRHMNVEIGTEAAQFPGKEYINGVFLAVYVYLLLVYRRAVPERPGIRRLRLRWPHPRSRRPAGTGSDLPLRWRPNQHKLKQKRYIDHRKD
jgi:hypothetical protein